MAVIIFRLNGVPDDEADEVRALLTEKGFDYYETSAGRWGISLAALWLKHDEDKAAARALIEACQSQRQARVKAEYAQRRAEGQVESFLDRVLRHPLQIAFYVLIIILIIYLSLSPFIFIGE
jgi:hypothetical protein